MLHIRLFGRLEISADGRALGAQHTKKCEALLAMLALRRGHALSREQIVGELWGDFAEDKARKCLSSDLWCLKNVFKSAGLEPQDYFECSGQSIAFDAKACQWVDVHAFQAGLSAVGDRPPAQYTPSDMTQIEAALAHYRGDLVQDIQQEYFLVLRESLRAEYMCALESLMQYFMFHAQLDKAIDCGRKLLALDPLFEHVHQELMLCHFRVGNRAAALRQYATCEQILWEELQIEPMHATREIYMRLVANESVRRSEPEERSRAAPADRLASALRHLKAATLDVQAVQSE